MPHRGRAAPARLRQPRSPQVVPVAVRGRAERPVHDAEAVSEKRHRSSRWRPARSGILSDWAFGKHTGTAVVVERSYRFGDRSGGAADRRAAAADNVKPANSAGAVRRGRRIRSHGVERAARANRAAVPGVGEQGAAIRPRAPPPGRNPRSRRRRSRRARGRAACPGRPSPTMTVLSGLLPSGPAARAPRSDRACGGNRRRLR